MLLWRGEIMDGAELDIDLPGEPSSSVLGTVTIAEMVTVGITAGVRRVSVGIPAAWGVKAGDALMLVPEKAIAGYALHDVVAKSGTEILVGLTCPALVIGASYSLATKLIRFS